MEIPYVVTPRKDTGLFNSKIAIWLFLASEVMLFGGFFSAYIFLRMGADFPWPARALPIMPGLLNTFILIGSSVTVVFAWASLKLRNWRKFQIYMSITVLCAAVFMVFKGMEYNVKFHHQAVRLPDFSVIEGHLAYELKPGADPHHPQDADYEKDHHGHKIEENLIRIEAAEVSFNTLRFHSEWVEKVIEQAKRRNSTVVLAADIKGVVEPGKAEEIIARAGEPLSVDLLSKLRDHHIAARKHNAILRTAALKSEWKKAFAANPGKRGWELATNVNIDADALAPKLVTEVPAASFKMEPPVRLDFKPRDIQEGAASSRLRDDTVINGKMLPSPMVFHYVDAIDFRHLAMKAHERGQDPVKAVENSWLVRNNEDVRKAWEWNKLQVAALEKHLIEKKGYDKDGKPKLEPSAEERFRIGWKDFAAMAEGKSRGEQKFSLLEEFTGPDYETRAEKHTFPEHFELPREQVRFASKFTPAWNNYYAIYFTITGLHGLHVIGGALVLAYYLFCGRKMYDTNPDWLANRVEIGGLFWHFVDLVWIFAFPIFYLM
ncbi:MAG: cytochrome c oxidase subunit 3 [Verrucomicrobiota bacterium]